MLSAVRFRSPALLTAQAQRTAALPQTLFWQGEQSMAVLKTARKKNGLKRAKRKAMLERKQAVRDARPKISQFKFDTFTNHILSAIDRVEPNVHEEASDAEPWDNVPLPTDKNILRQLDTVKLSKDEFFSSARGFLMKVKRGQLRKKLTHENNVRHAILPNLVLPNKFALMSPEEEYAIKDPRSPFAATHGNAMLGALPINTVSVKVCTLKVDLDESMFPSLSQYEDEQQLSAITDGMSTPELSAEDTNDYWGSELKSLDLNADLFACPLRADLVHRVVVWQRACARGFASRGTKDRGEVRGSTRKLYAQKGTGNARVGDKRSPIRRGGGRAFPKRSKDYSYHLPLKVIVAGLKTVLSQKVREGNFYVVDSLDMNNFKTKYALNLLRNRKWTNTVFVKGANEESPTFEGGTSKISNVTLHVPTTVNVYDLLLRKSVVFTEEGLAEVSQLLLNVELPKKPPRERVERSIHQMMT